MELNKAQNIFNHYFTGLFVQSIKQSNIGLINHTFIVETNDKKYILQQVNNQVFNKVSKNLENITLVKKWLVETNFPYKFPTPIGNKYYAINNEIWRIFNYVNNSEVFQFVKRNNQAFQAAKSLGSFYRCLNNKEANKLHITIENFHNGLFRLNQLIEANNNAKEENKNEAKGLLNEIISFKEVILKFDKLCKKLPKRVVHYDAKISNFLFDKQTEKVIAIIDLDTLMPGCVLSDIGDMIRTYSNLNGEESTEIDNILADKDIINQIIDGFCSEAILTTSEINNLYFSGKAITLIQCVRFLTDYLNNNVYYKTEYKNQNLIRAKNQWNLFQSLIN